MGVSRRGLIGSMIALVAAPAIVRVESLMKLPAAGRFAMELEEWPFRDIALGYTITRQAIENNLLYAHLAQLKAEGALVEYDHLLDVATVIGPAERIEDWHRRTLGSRLKGDSNTRPQGS